MVDFLEDFDAPPVEVVPKTDLPVKAPAPVVPAAQQKALQLRKMEDQIYEESAEIMRGVMRAHKVADELTETPPEWIAEHGKEKADEMFRLARYGKMSRKDAPVSLFLAQGTLSSIVKARSTEKAGARVLNVTMVQFPQAQIEYPRKKVESER